MPLKDTAAFLYMQDLDGNLFRIPADKVKVFLENQEQEKQRRLAERNNTIYRNNTVRQG